jgi:hypothetical protein
VVLRELKVHQREALRTHCGHGATLNFLVRKGLLKRHQKVEYGLYDGRIVTSWYTATPEGKRILKTA